MEIVCFKNTRYAGKKIFRLDWRQIVRADTITATRLTGYEMMIIRFLNDRRNKPNRNGRRYVMDVFVSVR